MTQASFIGLMSATIVLGFFVIEGSIFWLGEKYNFDPMLAMFGSMLISVGMELLLAVEPESLVHATDVDRGVAAWICCLLVLIGTVGIIWTIVDAIRKRKK